MDHIILYCKLKSDFIENNQIIEISPFTEIFSGNLEEENKCKICKDNCKEDSDFLILKFSQFEKNQKNFIKNNRKKYFNLLSDEICSKRNILFRTFETFFVGVFDYLFDFLTRNNDNNKSSFFGLKNNNNLENFYFCENCNMNNESFKNYSFKTLPNILLFGFDQEFSDSSQNILNFKLEKQLNLSYFKNKNPSQEEKFWDKNIEEINKNFNNLKKEDYNDFLYNLKGFVKLQKNGNNLKYINYIKLKNKWIKIEDFKQTEIDIKNLDTVVNYENEKIVFCIYEKLLEKTEKFENIKIETKLRNQNNLGVNLPHNIINKYLYLNENTNFSSDFDFCKHYFLKPLYEDIYLKNNHKKNNLLQNKTLKIDFTKQKLFNKNFFDKTDQSSAKLKYLSNSDIVSKPLSDFFLKNNYITNKNFNLNKMNYIEKCKNCEKNIKKFVIKRIYHKALIMKLLSKNNDEEKKFLVEKFWFKNYKQFLLTDLRNDHMSKIFYDYNYVTEIMNQDIEKLYRKFHKKYSCDFEIAENEFVFIDKNIYFFLKSIFNSEKDVYLKDNGHLMIVQNNGYNFLNLSFEENFVFEKLKKEDFDVENFEYKELIFLNRKMNALIDFKICSTFSIFNFDSNLSEIDKKDFRERKLKKIQKYFGRKNMDKLEFDPCQIIFNIFNHPKKTTKTINSEEKSVLIRESKLVKNFNRENLNFIISNNQMSNINNIKNINDIKKIKKEKKMSLKNDNSNYSLSESESYTASISNSDESEKSDLFLTSNMSSKKNSLKKIKKNFEINFDSVESENSKKTTKKNKEIPDEDITKEKKNQSFNENSDEDFFNDNDNNKKKKIDKEINFEDSINNSLLDSVGFSDFNNERESQRFSGLMSIDNNNKRNLSGLELTSNKFRNSNCSIFKKEFEFSAFQSNDSNDVESFLKGSGFKGKFSIFSHNSDMKYSILATNHKDNLDTSSEIENDEVNDKNNNINTSSEIENNEDLEFDFKEDLNVKDKSIDAESEEIEDEIFEQNGNVLNNLNNNSDDQFLELENEMKKFEKIYLNEDDVTNNEVVAKEGNSCKRSHFASLKQSHLVNSESSSSKDELDRKFDYRILKKNAKYVAKINLKKLYSNSNCLIRKLTALKTKKEFKKPSKGINNKFILIINKKEEEKENKGIEKSLKIKLNTNEKEKTDKEDLSIEEKTDEEDLSIEEKDLSQEKNQNQKNYSFSKSNQLKGLQNSSKDGTSVAKSGKTFKNKKLIISKKESCDTKTKSLIVEKKLDNYINEKNNYEIKSRISNKDLLTQSTPLKIKENISPLEKKMKNILPLSIKEIKENPNEDLKNKKNLDKKDNGAYFKNDSNIVKDRIFKDILNNTE